MRNFLRDSQEALGFLVNQTSFIEAEVYRTQYPDIQYEALIPVDTAGGEWVKSITFFSMDKVGQANWFHHNAKDVPIADVNRNKFEVGVEMAAIGYQYTLEELGQAMMIPGMNLTAERADAARRAYEEFVDYVALYGDTSKNWTGLLNDATVTTVIAATTAFGASGTTVWADKTADQILLDVNDALTGIWTGSATVEMADTLLLPPAEYNRIATKRIPDTSITVLQFLMQYNVYTAQTGQQLMIRAVRGLETAGTNGSGRMVAYRRDPQVLKIHIPMPHRFLPVWQTGPLVFDIPGIFRLGPVEIRRPSAIRYVDGLVTDQYT